ncbi:MAG: response regulator [Terriglobia bacterium]
MKTFRILIADDHEMVRRGIRAVMEAQSEWEVCGEAPTGRGAVEKAKQLKPDLVILDISMPDLNGLEATRQILKAIPKIEILILTIHESEQVEREVLAAGAHGYILKSDDGQDLVAAVESLRRHRPFFTTRVTKMVLENYLRTGIHSQEVGLGRSSLTPREREVAQLLAEGNSNKEVAAMLGISFKTAESHRANIMRKLSFHSLSELVHYAIRNNMVEL